MLKKKEEKDRRQKDTVDAEGDECIGLDVPEQHFDSGDRDEERRATAYEEELEIIDREHASVLPEVE